jgi:dTDP-4-amino-4,6-dideoxygalactose transaminase
MALRAAMEQFFGGRQILLASSGTSALSRAIAQCAARRPTRNPEVLLPAYGCPDLAAACLHASVRPRLVEIRRGAWGYDPDALQLSLSSDTVAIVAVNFLGIGDGSAALIEQSRAARVPLIQDSAQFLPRAEHDWRGDYVVLSFGRGKPLNLLGGGALIGRGADLSGLNWPEDTGVMAGRSWRDLLLQTRCAAVAFNVLTHPNVYWTVSRLPGTGVGEVCYRPLKRATALPSRAWNRIGAAFDLYRRRPSYSSSVWNEALAEWESLGVKRLVSPGEPSTDELLRLPLLAPDRDLRDALVAQLNRRGLGASAMYGSALHKVAGAPAILSRQGPFPNAEDLAARLLTLPTHPLVTTGRVTVARSIVRGPGPQRGGTTSPSGHLRLEGSE